MLSATLVWIGVLRVLLAQREREPADGAESVGAAENEGAALTAV
jgi:hypothetical protein